MEVFFKSEGRILKGDINLAGCQVWHLLSCHRMQSQWWISPRHPSRSTEHPHIMRRFQSDTMEIRLDAEIPCWCASYILQNSQSSLSNNGSPQWFSASRVNPWNWPLQFGEEAGRLLESTLTLFSYLKWCLIIPTKSAAEYAVQFRTLAADSRWNVSRRGLTLEWWVIQNPCSSARHNYLQRTDAEG